MKPPLRSRRYTLLVGDGRADAHKADEVLDQGGLSVEVRSGDLEQALKGLAPTAVDGSVSGMETRDDAGWHLEGRVVADGVEKEDLFPLYDPQTSGGLLVAVPADRATAFVRSLEEHGGSGAVIGEVVEGGGMRVTP